MSIKIENPLTMVKGGTEQPWWRQQSQTPCPMLNSSITVPSDFDWVFDVSEYNYLYRFIASVRFSTTPTHVTIKISDDTTYIGQLYNLQNGTGLSEGGRITIIGSTKNATTIVSLVRFPGYADIIDGDPIDFTSATTISGMTQGLFGNSISIRFVPNTLSISVNTSTNIGNSFYKYDDASLVSFCNCLKEGLTGKTMTTDSTTTSRLSTITGTVSLDSTSTYHIFTQDSTGSTTLADFITNTKGWTLA